MPSPFCVYVSAPFGASKLVSNDLLKHNCRSQRHENQINLSHACSPNIRLGQPSARGESPGRILTRFLSYFDHIKTLFISTRSGDKFSGCFGHRAPARDLKLCCAGQICQPHLAAATLVVNFDSLLPVFCLAASG